jgi:hypothetical protein
MAAVCVIPIFLVQCGRVADYISQKGIGFEKKRKGLEMEYVSFISSQPTLFFSRTKLTSFNNYQPVRSIFVS